MDPDADFDPDLLPAAALRARDTTHSSHASRRSPVSRSHLSSRTRESGLPRNDPSHPLPPPLILRVSPASDDELPGYIYLAADELDDQEAIRAYFDSAGRTVTTLPCPNFDGFLLANSLRARNISFVSDLPPYILRLGRQVLQDGAYSSDTRPDLSWLSRSPSATSPSLLSAAQPSRSAINSTHVTQRGRHPPSRPDPDGITAPTSIAMRGHASLGDISPLSSSNFLPVHGGALNRGYILTQPSSSSSTRLPSSGASVTSSLAGSLAPTSTSSAPATPSPPLTAPPSLVTPVSIKDKPSDMGLKPITDKDSWLEAKKIIDARLRRAPYWPGESKELVTTPANTAASVWWEEVIAYYCRPPVSDLFVEESRFDGKGFEMIAHIDHHFHPSGAVDSLGHIFDLIDIKQAEKESVITLKARFSKVFSALKMGGITIDSPLQVGFMLRALLNHYQAVVQEFCLGRHSLTSASLQTVVDQCTNYDKDPWKGPVGRDGKPAPRGPPSASAAGADAENPYEALASKSFNHHFSRWKKAPKDEKGKCMFCFSTARNDHNTCDCPIIKNLGFKLEKRNPSSTTPRDAASHVTTEVPPPNSTPSPTSPPTPLPTGGSQSGSAAIPGAFSAVTETTYDSGDEFDYEGKSEGVMYVAHKPNGTSFVYSPASCSHTTIDSIPTTTQCHPPLSLHNPGITPTTPSVSRSARDPQGVNTVYLPKTVLSLLANPTSTTPPRTVRSHSPCTSLVVADTGATDHMLPDKSAFISYYPVTGWRVRMGNNSFAPIAGHGTAIISLNKKKILIRDCLHVPDLRNPLYSLRAHQRQRGCGFIGMFGLGMHVFFPTFILEVDTATDCHLEYRPLGRLARLPDLDYVQPTSISLQNTPARASTSRPDPPPPVTIKPDDAKVAPDDTIDITYASHWPKRPPSPCPHPVDISLLPPKQYTWSLLELDRDKLIRRLYTLESKSDQSPPQPPGRSTSPLVCMSSDNIVAHLHHPGTNPPAIRPCNTPNASDTKSHFTADELHHLTGCRCFWNYRHLVHASKDGHFPDNGEFPLSIGAYTTIPKAPRGKPIDHTPSKYLDVVHLDIAFGDCMSVGGFKYALIFVDRETRFNWCFGLKSLQHDDIISAFLSFHDEAGNLARQFAATVMRNYLGVKSGHSFTRNVPPSRQVPPAANPLTALLNPIGKSWCTCLVPI